MQGFLTDDLRFSEKIKTETPSISIDNEVGKNEEVDENTDLFYYVAGISGKHGSSTSHPAPDPGSIIMLTLAK